MAQRSVPATLLTALRVWRRRTLFGKLMVLNWTGPCSGEQWLRVVVRSLLTRRLSTGSGQGLPMCTMLRPWVKSGESRRFWLGGWVYRTSFQSIRPSDGQGKAAGKVDAAGRCEARLHHEGQARVLFAVVGGEPGAP